MEIIKYLGSGKGLVFFSLFLVIIFIVIFFAFYKSNKKKYIGNIMIPVAFIEIAVLFLVMSFSYTKREEVGPGVVPRLWAYGIIGLNIYLFIRAIRGKEGEDPKVGHLEKVFLFLVITIIYIFSVKYIGYYIATFGFIFLAIYILNYRRYLIMIAVAAGWLVVAYVAFYKFSYIPLPIGKVFELIF